MEIQQIVKDQITNKNENLLSRNFVEFSLLNSNPRRRKDTKTERNFQI